MQARRRLLKCLDRLEDDRRDFLAMLTALPKEVLMRNQPGGGWSAATTLFHLALVEEGMLAYMSHKRGHGMPPKAGFTSGIRLFLLLAALRSPKRFKAPSVVAPDRGIDIDVALERWDTARQRLKDACLQLPDALLDRALFKHPTAGRFTAAQGLTFAAAHARRHMRQMQATLPLKG